MIVFSNYTTNAAMANETIISVLSVYFQIYAVTGGGGDKMEKDDNIFRSEGF